MEELPPTSKSPPWGSTTKLVVALSLVAIVAALLVQFRSIIGPLILAFILAYLLHPVITRFGTSANLPWRTSVNIVYLVLVVFLIGLFTLTGLAVVQQIQSVIDFVNRFVNDLPTIAADLSTRVYTIGPFQLNLSQFDLTTLSEQLLSTVQPLLGRVTGLISTVATTTASTLGWLMFVLLIAYFLLAESGQFSNSLVQINIPGYNEDVRRLAFELKTTWNAFLRGQLILITLVMMSYTLLMTILGVRYSLAIAVMAGLARFVPYVGPLISGIVTFLIAFLQGSNYYGLQPLQFAILVVILAVVLDQIFDNVVSPRLMGQALGVHPAAVLVAAIIATRLIGIIGLLLAAPVLATILLFGRYMVRKMFDMDPWPESAHGSQPVNLPWARGVSRFRAWLRTRQKRT